MMITTRHSLIGVFLSALVGGHAPLCQAEDDWNVDGEHGELYVYGALREGACQLDMRSIYQEVEIGNTALGLLHNVGDSGNPSEFTLRLLDCQRSGGIQTDPLLGINKWDAIQPVITISFESALDPDNPSLLLMKGIRGAGLMIRDAKGRQIIPGMRGEPQFVNPGDNQIIYTVTPVRTQVPLIAGSFRTVVDFKVNYD